MAGTLDDGPEQESEIARLKLELEEERMRLSHQLRIASDFTSQAQKRLDGALLGPSKAMATLRQKIAALAATDEPVLLAGPVGVGHEAAARAIHGASARRGQPFIFVDCLALRRQDKTEFFGTGHGLLDLFRDKTPGKWGLAHGGSIYLHRIDALHEELAKELEKRMVRGRSKKKGASDEVDVRVMASVIASDRTTTTPDDRALRHLGTLTNLPRVVVPSLTERRADIEALVTHWVEVRSGQLGRTIDTIDRRTLKQLKSYSWPGNLEELESVIDCAVLASPGTSLVVDRALLETGNRIGQYELLEQLGAGAMGEVWAARHRLLARPAAIKLVKADASRDEKTAERMRRRFEREARATAALESPNTVELYDFGATDDGRFYYVMERLQGLDLETMVERHGPLPPERVAWLLGQVCGSLAEAHDRGLIHRDIKPENIFAAIRGHDHDIAKVLDFGIVRMESGGVTNLTGTAILGTPAYLAPELALANEVDPRADLYSLGCVAFLLLTGRLVFEGETAMAVIMARSTMAAPRVSSIATQPIDEALDDLIAELLERDPEGRPASAAEVRDRLDAIPFAAPWSRKRATMWWRLNAETPNDPG